MGKRHPAKVAAGVTLIGLAILALYLVLPGTVKSIGTDLLVLLQSESNIWAKVRLLCFYLIKYLFLFATLYVGIILLGEFGLSLVKNVPFEQAQIISRLLFQSRKESIEHEKKLVAGRRRPGPRVRGKLNEDMIRQISPHLESQSTSELRGILLTHTNEYTDEAFEAIRRILAKRIEQHDVDVDKF